MSKLTIAECYDLVTNKVFPYLSSEVNQEKSEAMIGIEVEMLICKIASEKAKSLPLYGQDSLSSMLEKFDVEGENVEPVIIDDKMFSIQLSKGGQLTFEPGAQLEYSTKPYPCLSDAVSRLRQIQTKIEQLSEEKENVVCNLGINPWQTVDEIGLQMNKPRYKAMDAYFSSLSAYGRRMMRQTFTVQVNMDFGDDESTLVKRFLASQYLAPFMTAVFANSPIVDEKLTEFKSFRSQVWQHIDPTRTGFVELSKIENEPTKKNCVDAYFDRLMNGNVIFVEAKNYEVPESPLTFKRWLSEGYKGVYPTMKDFETHMTLFFPEARAKGFLELRSVDGQSKIWQSVPASFYSALIYDDKNLDKVVELLKPYSSRLYELWNQSSKGLHGEIAEVAKKLAHMALEGFDRLPPCFKDGESREVLGVFINNFTLKDKSPADDIIEAFKKDSKFTYADLLSVEKKWNDLLA